VLATIGSPAKRKLALAELLTPGEVPGGGWGFLDERAWRSGFASRHAPAFKMAAQRAFRSGRFEAMRTFQRPKSVGGCSVRVIPFVSREDALASASTDNADLVGGPIHRGRVVDAQVLAGFDTITAAGAMWAVERDVERRGHKVLSRQLCAVADDRIVIVSGIGEPEEWTWRVLGTMSALQAAKIRGMGDA
jgi:hypothetical protein